MSRIMIVAGCGLAALNAVLAPHTAAAQSPRAGGATATITGVVRDSTRGALLPFAVISVKTLGIQRFTSDSGSFALANLPAGEIVLQVRRLGFSLREVRVDLRAGERRTLSIDLAPIAVTLNAVVVQTSSACEQPGPPRADGDSAFATVFEQLRQNAEQ